MEKGERALSLTKIETPKSANGQVKKWQSSWQKNSFKSTRETPPEDFSIANPIFLDTYCQYDIGASGPEVSLLFLVKHLNEGF